MTFLPSCGYVNTTAWIHHLKADEMHGEKRKIGTTQECCLLFRTSLGSNTMQNNS